MCNHRYEHAHCTGHTSLVLDGHSCERQFYNMLRLRLYWPHTVNDDQKWIAKCQPNTMQERETIMTSSYLCLQPLAYSS